MIAAWILLLLFALQPTLVHPQTPYSDAAFSTFIAVSANGTNVTARITFLNITYFYKANESKLGEVKAPGDLHKPGNYSIYNYTASVDPLANASLRFRFEGMEVAGNGVACDPVQSGADGTASCSIMHYKDQNGAVHAIEDYRSCGYVTITSDEMFRGGVKFPSATQTAVVCPSGSAALSAFGPSIYNNISNPQRLPYCLPAMLIAGLLVAAMYYSGRDPLSLFDITTPRLPKTQTFKVKMGASPQMLRQVTRRYLMIKRQARQDSLRMINKMAKASGKDATEAKRRVNALYDRLDAAMKKGALSDMDRTGAKKEWADIVREFSKGAKGERMAGFNRDIGMSSGLLMAYLQTHAAMRAMQVARGKGKGNIVAQQVTKLMGKATDASVAWDTSKTGRLLSKIEKIPLVPHVISTPGKYLDVIAQFRGSRAAIKGLRNEMVGQAAYKLGHRRDGGARGIYRMFENLHVRNGQEGKTPTRFGKVFTKLTGKSFGAFDKKHDLSARSLVDYYKTDMSMHQLALDAQNGNFREIAGKLLFAMPVRGNAAKELAAKLGDMLTKEQLEALGRANTLNALFRQLQKAAGKGEAAKVVGDLKKLAAIDSGQDADVKALVGRINASIAKLDKSKDENATAFRRIKEQIEMGIICENKIKDIMAGKAGATTQHEKIEALIKLLNESGSARDSSRILASVNDAKADFGKAEERLRTELALAYLDKDNRYAIADKDMLKNAMGQGETRARILDALAKEHGADIKRIFGLIDENGAGVYRNMVDARAASTGRQLADAVRNLMDLLGGGLSADDRKLLASLAATYSAKGGLSAKERVKISGHLDSMKSLGNAERRIFAAFDQKASAMKQWAVGGGFDSFLKMHETISEQMNRRILADIKGVSMKELAREASVDGKAPLELAIYKALLDLGIEERHLKDRNGRLIYRTIDALDEHFGKTGDNQFRRMIGEKFGADSHERVLKSIMKSVMNYSVEWTGSNFAAAEILHNGKKSGGYMVNFARAARDVYDSPEFKSNHDYLRGEKPMYQREMGYAGYSDVQVSAGVFSMREWEKIAGYVVSHRWSGTSRGEQVLGLYDATKKEYNAAMNMYRTLYENLINRESVFYDAKFAEKWGGRLFDAAAYDAIMERGYRWQDKKNGLELLMSVDRKSVPMLEYEARLMPKSKDQNGNDVEAKDCIVRKGMVVDYAPLLARTMGSLYASREVGFVILENRGGKWVYTDPFKNNEMQGAYSSAMRQPTMRSEITEALAGMRDGSEAKIKVVSTKDFITQAGKRPDVFGEYNAVDKKRGQMHALAYRFTMFSAEMNYGAFSERLDNMSAWYSAQWQLRQTLNRLAGLMGEGMTGGERRWKYDGEAGRRVEEAYRLKEPSYSSKVDEETREKLDKEMRRLEKGDGTGFADSAKAWWHNWHGRIAASIANEIGNAESNYYNARLELRALDSLHAKNGISGGDYAAIRNDLEAQRKEMHRDYIEAKKEYGDFNRMLIGWTSSHSQIYNPQRTLFNMGVVSRLLDSHFQMGTNDAFYQITESSVMRDPRVAIGAGPGMDYSWYVGYHTGQNVYERARFWATNSLWEEQTHLRLNIAYAVHKWWNEKASFLARYTAGYPAPVKSDMMYAPDYEHRTGRDYFKALLIIPFQSRAYTDYYRARLQDTVTFSGIGHMLAAYQSMGGQERGEEGRSWARKMLDSMGMESSHNFNTPFRIAWQQRYVEQVPAFDRFIDEQAEKERRGEKAITARADGEDLGIGELRRRLDNAIIGMDEEKEREYRKAMFDAIGNAVTLRDRRGVHVRNVFSGSDIQEDGSRNRFLDMYIMFHSNVFAPTIPGMLQSAPIKGDDEWHSFPQVARQVENAPGKSWLGMTKNYWEAGYDEKSGMITFADRFSTRQDAVAEAYRNDTPLLLHLMKMQSKEIGYAPVGTPSLYFLNPVLVPLAKYAYRTAVHTMPALDSLRTTTDSTWLARKINGEHREKHGRRGPGYEYPAHLYRADYLADEAGRTGEFLKRSVPGWKWVAKKIRKSHHATGAGRKKLSDESLAESYEMLLATGLYSDDFE